MPRYYTRFRLHARTHAIGLQLLGALSDLVVGSPLYFMPTRRLGPYAGARRPPANDNKSLHQSRGVCDMSVHKHMSKHTHTLTVMVTNIALTPPPIIRARAQFGLSTQIRTDLGN